MKKNKFENKVSLEKVKELRKAILSFNKNLEDDIAYNMPAFRIRLKGMKETEKSKILCCYLVCKNHLGLYPYSGNVLKIFDKEIKALGLKYSSGALQLSYESKIPSSLIKKILKARLEEIKKSLQ